MAQQTRLTKTDLRAIDMRAQADIDATLGKAPTLADVRDEAKGAQWLMPFLRFINAVAMALTLLATEIVQAAGAILLLLTFGVLESERIFSGAMMLGLNHDQSTIAAIAVVSANIILPVYRFRNVRGKSKITRTRHTARGFLMAFIRRLFNRPQAYETAANANPTLRSFETAATWAALSFALLAVLGNLLAIHETGKWYTTFAAIFSDSTGAQMLEFLGGFLLSIVGVMGLQSVSHELAVRAHEERPQDARELLEKRQAAFQRQAAAIRRDVEAAHIEGKLADQERKAAEKAATEAAQASPAERITSTNGSGGPFG